jgi:hypothetical protein
MEYVTPRNVTNGSTAGNGVFYTVRADSYVTQQAYMGSERIAESRVEPGSDTFTVALRVVGGDEKRTRCLGIQPEHPVPGGYRYGDLALQVKGVSNLSQ